ncbi:hypothetical protein FQR65_LT05739 [Abscondita terminalis]|nr:hypothetical protein FQR65_LT05739 [Abscondita terminalis]
MISSVLFISLCMVWSTSSSIIPASHLILHNAPLPVIYNPGLYNFKSSDIRLPQPILLNTAWPWAPQVKQAKIETLNEEPESTTPAPAETTEAPEASEPPAADGEDGSYKEDKSGDYVPDNSGDYVQDDSGSYKPEVPELVSAKIVLLPIF